MGLAPRDARGDPRRAPSRPGRSLALTAEAIAKGASRRGGVASAFEVRACLAARQGRLSEALADQQRAIALHGRTAEDSAAMRRTMERARRVAAALRAAVAAGKREPLGIACAGLLDQWSRPRARSPLIGAAARSGD